MIEIGFENPSFLIFLMAGFPILIASYIYNLKYKKEEALKFSNFEAISRLIKRNYIPAYFPQLLINIIILLCLVFAGAGMIISYTGESKEINFGLTIDASSSMSAQDIQPNRIGAAKKYATDFIEKLPIDAKATVVSFAGTSFIEQRLTNNKNQLISSINKIKLQSSGGTDIGTAIVNTINLIYSEEIPSVMILVTDGQNTVGLSINEALEYAKANQIIIYTIGIGTIEGGSFVKGSEEEITMLNEDYLKGIAEYTNGKYYKASNEEELKKAYEEIQNIKLKKVKLKVSPFLISFLIIFLIIEWAMSFTKYVGMP